LAFLKTRVARWAVASVLLILVIVLAAPLWLRGMGHYLVSAGEPFHADMIVVLAGDETGNRIIEAAEMVRQGWAPKVLVSGPSCCYGYHESDFAIPFAVSRGYPAAWFIPLARTSHSTREEAEVAMREMQRRGVKRFMVVTSDYHTRRAGRVYRSLAAPASFRVVAAPDKDFTADGWWHTREGRKQAAFEWMKTVADWAGL
jgi:uncharacterized SAM-binding protein YcdF (DUF218 family)